MNALRDIHAFIVCMSLVLATHPSTAKPPDGAAIDATLAALYESFCFDPGQEADWPAMSALFAPGAVFVAPFAAGDKPSGVDEATFLRDFRAWVLGKEMSTTGLHERIVHTTVETYGVIAHAWVTFEAFYPERGEVRSVGVDSIALVLDRGTWKLVSFTPRYESPEQPLPARFWPKRRPPE